MDAAGLSREAISLEDAYHVFRKALAVLRLVNEALDAPAHREFGFPPEFRWPNHWVERTCRNQFAAHGRVTLFFGNGRRVWVIYGYEPIDGETNMTVWLEADPKHADVRGVVRDWAKRHDSLADWGRPVEGWPVLKTTKRAILVDSSQDAVAWFVERIDQLMGAGCTVRSSRRSRLPCRPTRTIPRPPALRRERTGCLVGLTQLAPTVWSKTFLARQRTIGGSWQSRGRPG